MAVDGLGLVYDKQGNTGAAAYNAPTFEIGKNPLDELALQLKAGEEARLKEQQTKEEERLKRNIKELDFDFQGWDIDQKRRFAQKAVELKKRGVELSMLGKELNDYTDPDIIEWRTEINKNADAALASKTQEDEYKKIKERAYLNPLKYDYEKTMTALNDWLKMEPEGRMDIDPNNLIVEKYNIYEPIKNLKPSEFMPTVSSETPETASSVSKFDRKKAEKAVDLVLENPINQMYVDYGIANGAFLSKQEYKKKLVDFLESRAPKETRYERKPMPEVTWDDTYINNTGTDELMNKLNVGKMTVNVPYYSEADGKIVTTPIEYSQVTQLGDVNATVAAGSMRDAETGEKISGSGVKNIKSGALINTPVYKGTDKVYPLRASEDKRKLINDDKIEYRPMIATEVDDDTVSTDITAPAGKKTVWVTAESVLKGTSGNKALEQGAIALKVYQKKANELNKKDKKKLPGT